GLEQALDLRIDLLANTGLGMVNDDHSAVRQVANALAFVFAFADNAQGDHFAGQQHGAHGFGQLVQVDVVDGLKFGNFAQVMIVCVKLGAQVASKPDQLGINILLVGKIAVMDLYFIAGIALDAIEHFESTPAARAFDGVGGIGDLLE